MDMKAGHRLEAETGLKPEAVEASLDLFWSMSEPSLRRLVVLSDVKLGERTQRTFMTKRQVANG
jgi:hypothetical protein